MSSIGMTPEALAIAIAEPLERVSQSGNIDNFIDADGMLNAMRDATLEIDSEKGVPTMDV